MKTVKHPVLMANGKVIDLDNPVFELNDLLAIAHSLSLQCRFGGHINQFYSVAQHSMLVSTLVPAEFRLEALLHDAHEAITGDIKSDVKKFVGREKIDELETKIDESLRSIFGPGVLKGKGRFAMIPEVRAADLKALQIEAYIMFPGTKAEVLHEYFGPPNEDDIKAALKNPYLQTTIPNIASKWMEAVQYETAWRGNNISDKLTEVEEPNEKEVSKGKAKRA